MAAALTRRASSARRRSLDPASPVQRRRAHAGQGGDLLDLLRQLQRAGHRPRPARDARAQRDSVRASSRRRPAAACPSSRLGDLEAVERLQEHQHPAARASWPARATRSSPPIPSCTLMFKQELPLMFPDDAGRAGRAGGDVRSVRVPRRCATRTGC
ncbi:MAG: hypothetical protein MZW92_05340 [Comamonadaceae bacterium]|nr:hypothetical protein [Comamonadaceae bacterium]